LRTGYDLRILLFRMVPFFLMTRAGVEDRLERLRRLERFVPAFKKINFNEGRNSFIFTFTQFHYRLFF
jgi:hypothetical protein